MCIACWLVPSAFIAPTEILVPPRSTPRTKRVRVMGAIKYSTRVKPARLRVRACTASVRAGRSAARGGDTDGRRASRCRRWRAAARAVRSRTPAPSGRRWSASACPTAEARCCGAESLVRSPAHRDSSSADASSESLPVVSTTRSGPAARAISAASASSAGAADHDDAIERRQPRGERREVRPSLRAPDASRREREQLRAVARDIREQRVNGGALTVARVETGADHLRRAGAASPAARRQSRSA